MLSTSTLLFSFFFLSSLRAIVKAHIQMASPLPFRSPLPGAQTPEEAKDYNNLSPLLSDGPFPCKGFIGGPEYRARDQWTAGQTVTVTTQGSAVHDGGCRSLQLHLFHSYS